MRALFLGKQRSSRGVCAAYGSRVRARRSAFLLLLLAGLALRGALGSGSAAAPRLLLPDLRQLPPGPPRVLRTGPPEDRRFRLAFASAVDNVGDGPLVVAGSVTADGVMRADQIVRAARSGAVRFRAVAFLRYARARDHGHWHLLPFETYELRGLGKRGVALRARKAGFCLGDGFRARVQRPLAGAPTKRVFTRGCGRDAPGLSRLVEGISVGYGDVYGAGLTGQSFDVTGLAVGDYVVVHRVNPGRRLRESDYANNVASLRVRLSWPRGRAARPLAIPVRICSGSDRCGRGGGQLGLEETG